MPSLSGAVEYVVELYDSDANFGPNVKQAEIWDARNVGWSRYDRVPGKAFCTLPQTSPFLSKLIPLTTHCVITRISPTVDTTLFKGEFIDYNSTGDDIIFDFYDYKALLSLSRSRFKFLYPSKLLGTEVVSPEWVLAKGAASSILAFVTTGVIENPDDGAGTDLKTSVQFGTLDQNRLQLFFDMSEMGRVNTGKFVSFDIDLTNTFSFTKNKTTSSLTNLILNGNVSDYQYQPGWIRHRNDLATVATSTTGGAEEITATDATDILLKGLRQDVATLRTLVGAQGTAVVDQQRAALAYQLQKAVSLQPSIAFKLLRNAMTPYAIDLGEKALLQIVNGIDNLVGKRRCIGWRGFYAEGGESLTLLVDNNVPFGEGS